MESITLEKLANSLGGTPLGSLDSVITSLQDSKTCNKHSVCYIKDHKFSNSLSSNAGAVYYNRRNSKEKLTIQKILLLLMIPT